MSVRSLLVDAFYSLGRNVNKRSGDMQQENAEGVIGVMLPELTLDLDDEKLVELSDAWEKVWNDSDVKQKWVSLGDENEKYWQGEQYDRPQIDKRRPDVDNVIFEGLETYLPQVTRRNPEAMVQLAVGVDQSAPNQAFARALQLELAELADDLKMRLKLKGAARHWSLRLVGAIKFGWDLDNDRPAMKVVRPTKLILDPVATVDEDGYTGLRIGEHRKLSANTLIALIEGEPKAAENKTYIEDLAKHELATEIGFIEWWTPEYLFWKLDSRILMKRKNPHWNYDEQEAPTAVTGEGGQVEAAQAPEMPAATPEMPQGAPAVPQLPDTGPQAPAGPRKGINHFASPRVPYILLSVYNLGKQPVDVTSNITQNLANQDRINKRNKQIDKNADTANNGLVVSLERSGLNQDQAKRAANALRAGGVVAIATGNAQEAVYKPPMSELPAYVYNQLVDTRNRVRDIWGIRGSSPAGLESDTTVRGKVLTRGLDTDRMGGGISEILEQYADDAYNWLTQLLYVYDDRFQEAIAKGVPLPKVKISVKEGSLLPKDSTTIANQAIELSTAGKMSLIDMYKRLDYPNPEELAANVWLEANAPEILFKDDPRVQEVMKAKQQAGQQVEKKAPSESISFKDLPPEGKAQMAAQAGIQLHPEGIAAHDAHVAEQSKPAVPLPEVTKGP